MPIKSERERDWFKSGRKSRTKKLRCSICGTIIIGRAWRIDERRFSCTKCANEKPRE